MDRLPPTRPQGLNQFVEPDVKSLAEWRAAVAHAQNNLIAGRCLIDKTLAITGERELVRTLWPIRFAATVVQIGSLGLLTAGKWRLTSPKPITSIPLRYEYAYGGECRINEDDPRAKRLRKKYRLTAAQAEVHAASTPGASSGPAALAAFECNAVGRGYAQPWYTRALGIHRLPAPQIEPQDSPFSVAKFMKMRNAKKPSAHEVSTVLAGFGVRAKVHPERRALAGTVDQCFATSEAWLPKDFDFAIWNAAPVDQQTEFLRGDECIELTNMCAPGSAGARQNSAGDTFLKLQLPGHSSTLLVRMQNGTMFFHPMKIDTLIVEPEERKISVVWRAVLGKTSEIRAVEANLHKEFEAEFMRQLDSELDKMDISPLMEADTPPMKEHHG